MTFKKKPSSIVGIAVITVAALLVVTAVLVNRYVAISQAARQLPETSPATTVRVARVERRAVVRQAEFHGFLIPFEELSISADVMGEIAEQHVEVSSEVTQGQLLFKIDDAVRRISHEDALAALDRAASEHALAAAQWDRVRGLEGGQTTSIEHKQAESQFRSTGAIQHQAEAAVHLAALLLERTAVKSPIDGVVSAVFLRRGEYAQLGLPLVRIIDVGRLRLAAEIEDQDVAWVQVDQPAVLTTNTFPGEVFEGTVYRLHPQAIQTSRGFEIEIVLTNPDRRLRPGFFMSGKIVEAMSDRAEAEVPEVLLVPREAVTSEFGANFCFVVRPAENASDTQEPALEALRAGVSVLPTTFDPRLLRVVSGLEEGDVVVTKGLQHLSERTRVTVSD